MKKMTIQQWNSTSSEDFWKLLDIGGEIELPITAQEKVEKLVKEYKLQFDLGKRPVVKSPSFEITFHHDPIQTNRLDTV